MLENLMGNLCRVAIFLLCARVIVYFRVKQEYEKYFRLLISMFVLLQLLEPVGRLFGSPLTGDFGDWERNLWEHTALAPRQESASCGEAQDTAPEQEGRGVRAVEKVTVEVGAVRMGE